MSSLSASKFKSRSELVAMREQWRREGLKVGFTSGVFDILHTGHLSYLEHAGKLCDLLIVGINSDSSVRENKGPKRPIVSETDRARLISGLHCVSFVFVFDERNNEKNVSSLKPDLYIKAGDYSKDKLSSAPIVESYGGQIEIIKLESGKSSSNVVERILDLYADQIPRIANCINASVPSPAIFVDRDGTINENVEYLHEVEKFQIIPGALEGLKRLQDAGYRIVVITNQAGIGLGYFSKEAFYQVNRKMLRMASKMGLAFDRVYFCPHSKSDNCGCRKPEPGMIKRGSEELNLILSKSFVIGDSTADLEAARRAGCRSILVRTGHGGLDSEFEAPPAVTVDNLEKAAEWILSSAEIE